VRIPPSIGAAIRWNLRLWFEPMLRFLFPELNGKRNSATGTSPGTGYVILSLLLTPIYVPVCVLFTVATKFARR